MSTTTLEKTTVTPEGTVSQQPSRQAGGITPDEEKRDSVPGDSPFTRNDQGSTRSKTHSDVELLICMLFYLYTGKSIQKTDFIYTGINRIYVRKRGERGEAN